MAVNTDIKTTLERYTTNVVKPQIKKGVANLTEQKRVIDNSITLQKDIPETYFDDDGGKINYIGGHSRKSKNLCNLKAPTNVITGGSIDTINNKIITDNTGNPMQIRFNNSADIFNFLKINTPGDYTLNWKWKVQPTSGVHSMYVKVNSGSITIWQFDVNKKITVTNEQIQQIINAGDSRIQIYKGNEPNNELSELMLVKGSYTADTMPPYEPYYEIPKDTKVTNIVSRGANLFDFKALAKELSQSMPSVFKIVTFQDKECLTIGRITNTKRVLLNVPGIRYCSMKAYAKGFGSKQFLSLDNADRTKNRGYGCEKNNEWQTIAYSLDFEAYTIGFYHERTPEYELYVDLDSVIFAKEEIPYSPHTSSTYKIPDEYLTGSTALPSYGQGNPDNIEEYNYIDIVNQKYIQKGHIDEITHKWVAEETPKETQITLPKDITLYDNGTVTAENEYNQPLPWEIEYTVQTTKLAVPPSVENIPHTVVERDRMGRGKAGTPTKDNHGATKQYVDEKAMLTSEHINNLKTLL